MDPKHQPYHSKQNTTVTKHYAKDHLIRRHWQKMVFE